METKLLLKASHATLLAALAGIVKKIIANEVVGYNSYWTALFNRYKQNSIRRS